MTIWPRKHIKTPSQAFTRSKQIYRTGRSLKFCGTVHWVIPKLTVSCEKLKRRNAQENIIILYFIWTRILLHLRISPRENSDELCLSCWWRASIYVPCATPASVDRWWPRLHNVCEYLWRYLLLSSWMLLFW